MTDVELTADQARRKLYEIMQEDASFEEKVQRALELGKSYLDVENAHLTRINSEANYWEAIASTDPPDGQFPPGLLLDYQTTYCRRVLTQDDSVGLHDAPQQGWADGPAFDEHGLHCYHGTPIYVDDEPYGTVCFVSNTPRETPFDHDDTLFAELIARLLEHELERQRHQAETTRRSNSITVLSRVLRHNLRNEMTIVRGRISMLADQLEEDTYLTDSVFDSIDRVIRLSDKARKLETVVSTDYDRELVALDPLLDRIQTAVSLDYPDAAITTDVPADLSAVLMPSFELAITELVENAATHAGHTPEITVTVDETPGGLTITVADDGPGLPSQEQAVLAEGVETPLVHGSGLGLWMVYWIVTSHDGTITTTVDDGTTVTIRIPRVTTTEKFRTGETEVPRLRRGVDRFEAVFEESFDAMIIIDDDRRLIDANDHAAKLFETPRQELLGRTIGEFTADSFDPDAAWSALQGEGRYDGRVTIALADGDERVVEFSAAADIVPGQHLIVGRDVTERIAREQQLQTERDRFQSVFDGAFDAMVITNDEGEYVEVNGSATTLFGCPEEELLGRTIREFTREDFDFDESWAEFTQGEHERGTFPLVRPDGTERLVEYAATTNIVPGQHLSILRDITERAERERELEVVNQRLDAIFNNTHTFVGLLKPDGTVIEANDTALSFGGLDREAVVGTPFWETGWFRPIEETKAVVRDAVERASDGKFVRHELRVQGASEVAVIDFSIRPITDDDGEVTLLVPEGREITDRVEAEADLEGERQFTQSLLESLPDPVYAFDTDGSLIRWNDQLEAVTGYASDELDQRHVTEFVPEEEEAIIASNFQTILDERRPVTVESAFETSDGERIPYEFTGGPIETDDGDLRGVTGVGRVITEHEQLAEHRQLYEYMFDSSLTGIAIATLDGEIRTVNPRFLDMWGYDDEAAVLGRSVTEFWNDPDEAGRVARTVKETGDWQGELIAVHNNGTTFHAQCSASIVTDDTGESHSLMASFVDISDRVEQEQELRHQNEQLEEFASVVAHDLRNPLSVATAHIQQAQADDDAGDHLDHAMAALDRTEAIIEDTLVLAREGQTVADQEWVPLHTLAYECWGMVETAGGSLEIGEPLEVMADRSRLQHVFENLFRNAIQHGDGETTVHVGALGKTGFYVEDEGPGIPEEDREKVLEPGYTTESDGTGFGLTIVNRIAQAHGWEFTIADGPDGGARFEFTNVDIRGLTDATTHSYRR